MSFKAQIITMRDCIEEMLYDLRNGKEKGSTTHIPAIDCCWRWRKTEFNLWTGYNNEGKSLFLRYLSTIKVLEDDWRFLCACPEDYPAKEFFDDLIHIIAGQTTDRDSLNQISEQLYVRIFERIKDNYVFYYPQSEEGEDKGKPLTIPDVLKEWDALIDMYNIDSAFIDPLIKFPKPVGIGDKDDAYAAYITTLCTHFARKKRISLHLVAHQVTPPRQANTNYPKPNGYGIKGGGTWPDGVDNVLVVWRPHNATDKSSTEVIFASDKIKKQKLVGIPQQYRMAFNRRTNRYVDFVTTKDLYDFSKHFK
jgi:twinkle protein